MAQVRMMDTDGATLLVPDRISDDAFDSPTVTFIVCDPGQFIDGNSEELRFVPAPEPPVIERLEVVGIDIGTVGSSGAPVVELSVPPSDEEAIRRIEEWRAEHGEVDEDDDDTKAVRQLSRSRFYDW
jgi:hypothetical protein